MRITSANAFETSLASLQRRQSQLGMLQQQMTSGKRVLRASDDPAAAAVAERAMAAKARAEAHMRSLDASRTSMQLTESTLGDSGELLQQARELLVSAGDGSYSDSDRAKIADQLRGLRNDLLTLANRTDGAGRYLFGGQGSATPPLRDSAAGVVYDGSAGQLNTTTGEISPLSTDGRATWLQAPDPSAPGSTVSVFDALDTAVKGLLTTGQTGAQIGQLVATGIGQIGAAQDNLSSWRARAGQALTRADAIEGRLSQAKIDTEAERSGAVDLDMVAAISDYQNQQTGYDAALKTYSMVQRMSLFDYLK
jgi:flagellar hook-associated protein 3 FlgL